jgi:hypothetical protein
VEYRHEQIETLANVKAHKDGPSNYHDSSEFTFFTTQTDTPNQIASRGPNKDLRREDHPIPHTSPYSHNPASPPILSFPSIITLPHS